MSGKVLFAIWQFIRELSGDDAYERYLRHCERNHPEQAPLSRRAFWDGQLDRKWSGVNRCC
ncbi:MAG: YbdD/YjiX family protein [Gammaproteobacteria bacterium]|nr:YbdD/YjiX family protein [Gammaproteobacteria bacterium]MBA3732368.1 YbdD/YjiX family protein [Gammaproteobacteria bacterium]